MFRIAGSALAYEATDVETANQLNLAAARSAPKYNL